MKHNSADPTTMEFMKMPNEDTSGGVDKFLKDFIDIGIVLKDLVEEIRPIPTRTTQNNWAYPIQRM